MKKLLVIAVFSLLLSGNAYAKKIEISKCSTDGKFDKKTFIDRKFVVDEDRNVVSFVSIYQDSYLKKQREELIKENRSDLLNLVKKITTISYPIKYLGNEFIEAVEKRDNRNRGYIINLKNKTVEIVGSLLAGPPTIWKCK
jgi:hypothetical protein